MEHLASFDLVVNDLGGMKRRAESLPLLWELVAPGGFMLLDDMHKPEYRIAVHNWLSTLEGFTQYDVHEATTDSFGRYAYLIQRTEEAK